MKLLLCLVRIQDETREGAVLVVVSSVSFASVQFDIHLIPGVQVKDGAVAGVVVVLVCVLSDGTGPHRCCLSFPTGNF